MSNTERHTKTEVNKRAQECFRLRFESTPAITQEKWVEYCHEHYGDRSEQAYCNYWAIAKDMYDDSWKERLSKMLGPAVQELNVMLGSDNEKIRQRAIDQIFKYTGNDIQRIQADVKTDIKVTFGS